MLGAHPNFKFFLADVARYSAETGESTSQPSLNWWNGRSSHDCTLGYDGGVRRLARPRRPERSPATADHLVCFCSACPSSADVQPAFLVEITRALLQWRGKLTSQQNQVRALASAFRISPLSGSN